MTMKKLFTLAIATMISSQAVATEQTKFVAVDKTLETNLCVVAAQQGYEAAVNTATQFTNFSKAQLKDTLCNGLTLKRFAKKYQANTTETALTVYRFKPIDSSNESRFCAIAAEQGLQAAVNLGGKEVKSYICNGKDIAYFARKYQNS